MGATGPPAVPHRLSAALIALLAGCSGPLAFSAVDIYKLWRREPGLDPLQVAHAAVFGAGLNTMVGPLLGLALGLLLVVLAGRQDLAIWATDLWARASRRVREHGRTPEAGATVYAALLALGLYIAAGYKLNHAFFVTFKNQHLAALLLACLGVALILVVALAALALRRGVLRVARPLSRVPVLRLVVTAQGAAVAALLAALSVTVVLLVKYEPIVRIIDWRPLSYPSLALALTLGLLAVVLRSRARRIRAGRPAGVARRVALGAWALLFLSLWSYTFVFLGDFTTLRTALLRRGYGVARVFDLMSGVLDFDGDGYLSFFGGGDCAPWDPAVNPGAIEVPANGVDDNCFGGDLASGALRRRKRAYTEPRPGSLTGVKPNLVLITMDGLRADHVGCYGYKKPTSPNIDRLAARSTLFERAYAQAPSTRYSIPSFHTSKYSSQIPRENTLEIPRTIMPGALLAAEVFKAAGYRTGAALSYMVFKRSWGLDQGYDFYDNTQAAYYHGKGSPSWDKDQPYVLVDVAKKFLAEKQDEPFFLWVHFFEPHPPFVHRTEPHDFGTDTEGVYNGEIRFGDARVGELLDALAKHPAAGRTVIALSADHGRGLGEHGMATHGYDLFVENLHVPLIVHVPGGQTRRIKNPVGLIDILPTFINLAGIKKTFDMEGHSLVPQIVTGVEPDPERAIFSEVQVGFQSSHVINAITTRNYKLIYDLTYNTYQLFDLRKDPTEQRNVADEQPDALTRLKGTLFRVMERATLPGIQERIRSSLLTRPPPALAGRRVTFGDQIRFLGFEVEPPKPTAGQIMYIVWYVEVLRKPDKDYKFIVQLKGKDGAFFDAKHIPVDGLYPATKWNAGQIIRDRQHMRLPPQAQTWEVWVGFGTGHDILKPQEKLEMVNTAVKVGEFATY